MKSLGRPLLLARMRRSARAVAMSKAEAIPWPETSPTTTEARGPAGRVIEIIAPGFVA
jgi:hypothetical protein